MLLCTSATKVTASVEELPNVVSPLTVKLLDTSKLPVTSVLLNNCIFPVPFACKLMSESKELILILLSQMI